MLTEWCCKFEEVGNRAINCCLPHHFSENIPMKNKNDEDRRLSNVLAAFSIQIELTTFDLQSFAYMLNEISWPCDSQAQPSFLNLECNEQNVNDLF